MDSGAQLQFAALAIGKIPTTVTWVASSGVISSSGLFTAPSVHADTSVTIAAISTANPKLKASLRIKVTSHSNVRVSVTPTADSIASGTALQFTASVTGTKDTAVKWSASAGSISGSGLFTAPSVTSNTVVNVSATSAANSEVKGSAAVTVTPPSSAVNVTVTPSTSTLTSGATLQFTATVSGTSNTGVTWTAGLGSIDKNGAYSAPAVSTQATDTVSAISVSDPRKFATASVTINPSQKIVGVEYWVSPTGSDSADGSQNHPWASIAHADSALTLGSNGTIVHVLPGTYNVGSLTTTASGTASRRIQFISDVKWGAKLQNSSWSIAGNYTDVNGFELYDPDDAAGWAGISAAGNYVSILNNYVHNKGDDPALGDNCPGSGAINVNNTAHDALIDGNVIYSTGKLGGCQHSYGYGTSNHGIYVAGYHSTITNNLVSKAAGWGIHFNHDPCQNAVANNTVFYNYSGGIYVGGIDGPSSYCWSSGDDFDSFTNNLLVRNGWGSTDPSNPGKHGFDGFYFDQYEQGAHNKAYNNYLAGNQNTAGAQSNDIVNVSTQTIAQGENVNGGASYSRLFVNYHDEYTGNPADYQLSSSSAANDAGAVSSSVVCAVSPGVSPCVPTVDFNGTPRSNGNAPDIGAFE